MIEAAIESNIFHEVMVSTENEEIMNIALQYRAKVPYMRSDATADDMAMTHEVLLEVMDLYRFLIINLSEQREEIKDLFSEKF